MTTHEDHPQASPKQQRPSDEILADAIRVLTEAARLRRPELERQADGHWRPHPTRTEPEDWAEFVTQALAGAAANIGGIEQALAGRPGSWEADAVRSLLHSTVGHDEEYLFEHRTEPLHVVVDVEQILAELDVVARYDAVEDELYRLQDEATAHIDYSPYYWTYTRADTGEYVASDPEAPPWSIEAWRVAAIADGCPADLVDQMEQDLRTGAALWSPSIVKSPAAARAAAELSDEEDAIIEQFQTRLDALAALRAREWAAYGEAFAANIRREAGRRYAGTRVDIEFRAWSADEWDRWSTGPADLPEVQLIEFAVENTPLPGSGVAPKE